VLAVWRSHVVGAADAPTDALERTEEPGDEIKIAVVERSDCWQLKVCGLPTPYTAER